jgi:hypothetical protein
VKTWHAHLVQTRSGVSISVIVSKSTEVKQPWKRTHVSKVDAFSLSVRRQVRLGGAVHLSTSRNSWRDISLTLIVRKRKCQAGYTECPKRYTTHLNVMLRFQDLTAISMKVTVFWDVVPCSLVESDRCFKGAYCLHYQDDRKLLAYRYWKSVAMEFTFVWACSKIQRNEKIYLRLEICKNRRL